MREMPKDILDAEQVLIDAIKAVKLLKKAKDKDKTERLVDPNLWGTVGVNVSCLLRELENFLR